MHNSQPYFKSQQHRWNFLHVQVRLCGRAWYLSFTHGIYWKSVTPCQNTSGEMRFNFNSHHLASLLEQRWMKSGMIYHTSWQLAGGNVEFHRNIMEVLSGWFRPHVWGLIYKLKVRLVAAKHCYERVAKPEFTDFFKLLYLCYCHTAS